MQPGWLAGRHDEQSMSIDLQPLAERAGCRYLQGDIKRIDAATRTIEFTDGRTETWEALSLARSSIPCDARVPGAAEFTVPIRPMARAREIMPAVERAQQAFDQREIRIAVIGAASRGFETACALRARLLRDGTSATIMLVDGEPELLPHSPSSARTLAARVLQRLNIASALGARVVDLSRRGLRLTSGAIMPADVVVWTVGNAPAAGLTGSGMALDERGFVQFDEMLRSVSHPDVFVAGESADMGTALTDNVAAFCGDAPSPRYRRYQPPTRQLDTARLRRRLSPARLWWRSPRGAHGDAAQGQPRPPVHLPLSAAGGRHVEFPAGGPELRRLVGHSLLHVLPPRLIPHVLRDLHRAELGAAHRAEVRHLGAVGRQRLVVVGARGDRDRAPG